MAHNIEKPLFAPGGTMDGKSWLDADNFDVDILAEYLLDEGSSGGNGIATLFDFNLDQPNVDSTVVSPENSVDGNPPNISNDFLQQTSLQQPQQPPPMATFQQAAVAFTAQIPPQQIQQQPQQTHQPQQVMQPNFGAITLAPNPMANFQAAMNAQQQMQMGGAPAPISNPAAMMFQQMPGAPTGAPTAAPTAGAPMGAPLGAPAPKRQRIGNQPIAAASSISGIAPPNPTVAAATAAFSPSMLSGQQLAEAAAQAMQQGRGGRKPKSQAQIDRRRERNRVLAKRTRLRKKFFFESLQKEVLDLQRENVELKDLVRNNVEGDAGKKILDECDAAEKLPEAVLEACSELKNEIGSQDFNLVQSIQKSQHSFIITDPSLADNPIVFASQDFLTLTGYTREQVLGRNCRFLQGTDTSKDSIDEIRKGLANGDDVSVTLINYMADGTPFWNKLFIAALRDAQNNIVNFIGVSVKVAGPEPGHPEHGKPLPAKNSNKGADAAAGGGSDDNQVAATADNTLSAIEDSVTAAVQQATTVVGGQ